MMTDTSDRTLTASELAETLGGKPSTFWRLYKQGKIPGTQHGRRVFFSSDEVKELLPTLKLRGFRPKAEKSEVEKKIEEIEQQAMQMAARAALQVFHDALHGAQQQQDRDLQIALHRKIAEAIEALEE